MATTNFTSGTRPRLRPTDNGIGPEREAQVAELIAEAQRLESEAQRLRNEAARIIASANRNLPY